MKSRASLSRRVEAHWGLKAAIARRAGKSKETVHRWLCGAIQRSPAVERAVMELLQEWEEKEGKQ